LYKTNNFLDVKRHIIKKKPCSKIVEAYNNSDDQLIILTLLSNIECSKINKEIDHLKESSDIYKNKDRIFNILDNIDKNKLKKCTMCNEEFLKITDLRKHILISCFYKELEKEKKISDEKVINETNSSINNNVNSTITNNNNTNNTNITNNITNNTTNIYLEIKTPVPFDREWDISNIDCKTQSAVLMSKFMYTSLLEEILKNEINLNVIIDKNSESGVVYKNDIDKYINMKSKDIVSNTMDKLHKHLLEMNKSNDMCFENVLDYSRKMIGKKHIDYVKYPDIKNAVNNCITNIFINKKNDAIEMSKNIKEDNIDPNKGF